MLDVDSAKPTFTGRFVPNLELLAGGSISLFARDPGAIIAAPDLLEA